MTFTHIEKKFRQKHNKPFIEKIVIEHKYDEYADLSYLEQEYLDCTTKQQIEYKRQDKERLDKLDKGYWYPMGIIAKTDIFVPEGQGNFRIVPITSSGIWGIESDADAEYIKNEEINQIEDLKQLLKTFNVEIPKNVEIGDKTN